MDGLLTIPEFCALARISRVTFYRLPDPPKLIRINRRILISPADADDWCVARAGR
jgi:hypothetical protein